MDQIRASIHTTLCYSDIFHYPLTRAELWRYLVTSRTVPFSSFTHALQNLQRVKEKEGFYFLPGREELVSLRKKKERISKKKLQKAIPIIEMIAKIPTVELIGVSGSLAMHNADIDADCDIFLITKANTLWITRFLVLCIVQIKNVRRKRGDKKARDKICLNMLIDTSHLSFPRNRRTLYTAHEIVQMKILFSRNNTYEKFLRANTWVSTFLPNSLSQKRLQQIRIDTAKKKSFFQFLEPIALSLQVFYMKKHQTHETIANGFVAFHPIDYTNGVLTAFEKRKKKYGIL